MTNSQPVGYPFAAVVGQRAARRALLLLAVEPELRGVLIASESGSAKSTLSRAFGSLLTEDAMQAVDREFEIRTVELPLGVTEDRLLGGLDLERTMATGARHVSAGLLARANGGALYVDDINLLDGDTAAHVARALDSRQVLIEREGISAVHAANFTLVGSFNRVEGEPSSLLRDRVALIVDSQAELSAEERTEIIERDIRFKSDPADFVESFALETAELKSSIEEAGARLLRIRISKKQKRQIALIAMKLGVEGNRADVFALKAARANAALAGRAAVSEDDLVAAIELVLAPRATTFPAAQERAEKENNRSQSSDETSGPETRDTNLESTAGPIEDLIIQAIDTRIPKDLLSAAKAAARSSATGRRVKASTAKRGRYSRSTTRQTRDARVAIDATLRAAAPYQGARQIQNRFRESDVESFDGAKLAAAKSSAGGTPALPGRGRRVKIKPSDLRFKQFKHRSGILFIFAVDASGSMAVNRMAQAKGALTRLLEQAYLHRDKVALISFRGTSAEVLLAPTRSVELAKRLVDSLPAGGGTPISAGVVKAIELARLARVQGMSQAMLVLFTDGRANVGLRQAEMTISDELRHLGRLLQAEGIASIVVDTKPAWVSAGETSVLAQALGSRYVYLGQPNDQVVHEAVSKAAGRMRALRSFE